MLEIPYIRWTTTHLLSDSVNTTALISLPTDWFISSPLRTRSFLYTSCKNTTTANMQEKKSRICLKMLANTPDAHSVCVCVCVCAPVAAGVHGNKDEVGGLTCLDREADCLNSLAE